MMGKLVAAAVFWAFFAVSLGASAHAENTAGCYGSDCTGKNPVGLCDGDAYTVDSMEVKTGLGYAGPLDLRYSPSCAAYWGRFSVVYRTQHILAFAKGLSIPNYGRVTVWNPGEPSEIGVERDPAP